MPPAAATGILSKVTAGIAWPPAGWMCGTVVAPAILSMGQALMVRVEVADGE
jgi:hypothetical protein